MPVNFRVTIVKNDFNRIVGSAKGAVDSAVGKVAHDMVAWIVDDMQGSKSGRIYGRVRTTRRVSPRTGKELTRRRRSFHRASAPGESPAVETGLLANSIRAWREREMIWFVGTNMEHGAWLEYGTGTIAPRPFIRPAAKKFQPAVSHAVTQALRSRLGT